MAIQKNKVRIGGGEWRSRLLSFPDVPGLRPTPDRVRQTVFNWLGQDLHGLTCLDLFSGTGAMGFEALSRGAKSVVMVEKSAQAHRALLENQQHLAAANATILQRDALQFLAGNEQTFDVIFLDPPYQQGWMQKLLPIMASHLAKDGVVYAEAEFSIPDSEHWQVHKQGKAGNVFFHLLKSPHDD
jgi:16S rRNA (guanine966-N2)-methyltransferase